MWPRTNPSNWFRWKASFQPTLLTCSHTAKPWRPRWFRPRVEIWRDEEAAARQTKSTRYSNSLEVYVESSPAGYTRTVSCTLAYTLLPYFYPRHVRRAHPKYTNMLLLSSLPENIFFIKDNMPFWFENDLIMANRSERNSTDLHRRKRWGPSVGRAWCWCKTSTPSQ